jgi:hypothetical protein
MLIMSGLRPVGRPERRLERDGLEMQVELSNREASLVLAALRNWQEESKGVDLTDFYEAYFEEHEPLESAEIDNLCSRIAEAAVKG